MAGVDNMANCHVTVPAFLNTCTSIGRYVSACLTCSSCMAGVDNMQAQLNGLCSGSSLLRTRTVCTASSIGNFFIPFHNALHTK